MAPDSEPRTTKRRTAKVNAASQDPLPSPNTKGESGSTAPHTDAYLMDEGLDLPRLSTSTRRYDQIPSMTQAQRLANPSSTLTPVPQRSRQQNKPRDVQSVPRNTTQQIIPPEKVPGRKNIHWLFLVGLGMVAMLVLWVAGSATVAWGVQRYNDIHYGYPRTFQTDAVVGHNNDSPAHKSHFIAINLNRQAIVIEFMAGDPAKTVSYVAANVWGTDGDLAPVTLEFRDVTGDGKLDMIVHIQQPNMPDGVSVFINDGNKFRPVTANDKIKM